MIVVEVGDWWWVRRGTGSALWVWLVRFPGWGCLFCCVRFACFSLLHNRLPSPGLVTHSRASCGGKTTHYKVTRLHVVVSSRAEPLEPCGPHCALDGWRDFCSFSCGWVDGSIKGDVVCFARAHATPTDARPPPPRCAQEQPRSQSVFEWRPSCWVCAGEPGDLPHPRAPRDSVVDAAACDRLVGTAVGRNGLRVLLPRETNKREGGSGGPSRRVSLAGAAAADLVVTGATTGEALEGGSAAQAQQPGGAGEEGKRRGGTVPKEKKGVGQWRRAGRGCWFLGWCSPWCVRR
jgi:hypothetical protein